jgi:hypothetical protein
VKGLGHDGYGQGVEFRAKFGTVLFLTPTQNFSLTTQEAFCRMPNLDCPALFHSQLARLPDNLSIFLPASEYSINSFPKDQ